MKTMHRCPKCAGKRIWVIEKYRIPGEAAEGRELPLVPHQDEVKSRLLAFGRLNPVGHFDLYLCDGCGYSELWADGFRGLVPAPERGVRLIDTSDTAAGPFR
jgi:predicted nucleic-acid-binding Zn-ribbon protein